MDDSHSGQSRTREELRLMLFPDLTAEEGRRKVDAAFELAEDEGRARRIERLANDPGLDEQLLLRLRRLSDNGQP